ncbi:DUF2637 domain-containing protein [Streptomyces sp. NPDC057545]|uniref:DUF2637 domain-containing protein n=1 Tax=Streptomyces sp. NPDC057545 TaxID=3346164 RepID=UPI00369D77C7
MTTTIERPTEAVAPFVPEPVSGTPADASATAADASDASVDDGPEVSRTVKIWLGVASVLGGATIGVIGFFLSFGNLSAAGHDVFGFSMDDAPFFAVGVDAAIVTCLVLDLFMATIRTSWPLLRVLAHVMTLASVYFNAASHGAITQNWDKALAHGLMPVLFVIGVEAGRRILVHQAALPADHDVIPGHRWLLAGPSTWSIFKTMKLWDVSYCVAMKHSRERAIFNAWNEYKAEIAEAGLEEGSEKALARLPEKLKGFGLTVDEALALPDKMAREELRRKQEQEKRDRELERDTARAVHEAEKEALAHRKEMAALQADLTATEGVAGAQARGAVAEAEAKADAQARAATALTDAVESAEAAEAKTRAVEAEKRAVEAKRQTLEAEARAAEAQALKTKKLAETEIGIERAAEAKKRAAEANEQAAEAEKRAAEARDVAAQILHRAVEAEDFATLTQRQRRVRIVARLLLAAGEREVTNQEIAAAIGVKSEGTASEHRAEAVALIDGGYPGFDPDVPSRTEA